MLPAPCTINLKKNNIAEFNRKRFLEYLQFLKFRTVRLFILPYCKNMGCLFSKHDSDPYNYVAFDLIFDNITKLSLHRTIYETNQIYLGKNIA